MIERLTVSLATGLAFVMGTAACQNAEAPPPIVTTAASSGELVIDADSLRFDLENPAQHPDRPKEEYLKRGQRVAGVCIQNTIDEGEASPRGVMTVKYQGVRGSIPYGGQSDKLKKIYFKDKTEEKLLAAYPRCDKQAVRTREVAIGMIG